MARAIELKRTRWKLAVDETNARGRASSEWTGQARCKGERGGSKGQEKADEIGIERAVAAIRELGRS